MASLRKRKNSNVWWAQFYVVDSATKDLKQVRKSTGQTNKKAAMIAAIELERAAQGVMTAGSDRAQRAKAVLAQSVAEIEKETFTTLSARKYLADLLAIATGEDMPAYTVDSWMSEWLRRKARGSSKGTIDRYTKSIDTFTGWLGPQRRIKPLESVTMADVRKWRELLQDEGRTGKTVNKYVKDVAAAFRMAIQEGLINFNPCGALETLSTEDSLDRKPFTVEEVAALLRAAPTVEWRGLILVASFTGLRLGDAAKLSWAAIDLQGGLIALVPSKTKKKKREVRIPIQEELAKFLKMQRVGQKESEKSVLPTLAQKSTGARDGLSRAFVEIMAEAGVSRGKPSRDETVKKGKGRVTFERGFHSLRHTFTSWLRAAGVAEEDRMALTGHSTRESHAIYSHTDVDALRSAISTLPKVEN